MEQGNPPVGDIEEVFQEDPSALIPIPVVEVKVCGPVETHAVPSMSGGMRSFRTVINEVSKYGGADPRRRIARIICDEPFFVGVDQNSVTTEYAARWPELVPLELTHQEEIWIKTTQDAILTVITENWAS